MAAPLPLADLEAYSARQVNLLALEYSPGRLLFSRPGALAASIDLYRARPWCESPKPGRNHLACAINLCPLHRELHPGLAHEFGLRVCCANSHVNRQTAAAASLHDAARINAFRPGKKPFHTLNPAPARFPDGCTTVCGTTGGDRRPQA